MEYPAELQLNVMLAGIYGSHSLELFGNMKFSEEIEVPR
jgi:hypothetical protein